MITLACTGGIGSGKSYVCKIFSAMGVPVYDSDSRTKALYDEDPQLRSALVERTNGRAMAAKIFGNPSLMKKMKEIVYPAVIRDFTKWKNQFEDSVHGSAGVATDRYSAHGISDFIIQRCITQGTARVVPFVIFESAIILENPDVLSIADKILTISSPQNVRIERVKQRDGGTDEEIKARLNNQWTDEQREAKADFVIVSDNKTPLLPQAESVYNELCNFANI